MSEPISHLVIGAGPAGTRAAEVLARRDPGRRVVVVSEDLHPLYNRILLSKTFLESDDVTPEDVVMMPREAYAARGIELLLGRRVERLDPAPRTVTLEGGETLEYANALVATGSHAAPLPVAGANAGDVVTLRTLDDAVRLRAAAREAGRAVVIGGGLIGMEVSAALTRRGVAVTLLAREPWLSGHAAPEPVGHALERVLAAGGIDVRLGETVTGIEAEAGERAVVTEAGSRFVAPLVVTGVGVRYATDFLVHTDLLASSGGVAVDARLATGAAGLWAAGDVAAFDDPVLGARHHVEHWLHAQHQGRRAALNMTGDSEPFTRMSTYDTLLFDTKLVAAGAPALAESWTFEGEIERGDGHALGWSGARVVAAYGMGDKARPAELTGLLRRDAADRAACR